MKNHILYLIVLAYSFQMAFNFDCVDVSLPGQCAQLEGCSWSEACTGSFTPSCLPPDCYYIGELPSASDPDGTPQNPYNSLTAVFVHLGYNEERYDNNDVVLIIINPEEETLVSIEIQVYLTSKVTIQPLFSENRYEMDFHGLEGLGAVDSGPPSPLNIRYTLLKVVGATISFNIDDPDSYGFSLFYLLSDFGAGQLIFEDVDFQNCNSPYAVYLIGDQSQFTYQQGSISNSSTLFYSSGGTSIWTGITMTNVTSRIDFLTSSFIFGGSQITLDQCTRRKSPVTAIGVPRTSNGISVANFTIFNSSFQNLTTYTLTSFTFAPGRSSLISLSGGSYSSISGSGIFPSLIQDTSFTNIDVAFSIVGLQNNRINITMNRVIMTNIKRINSWKTPETITYLSKGPIGICCTEGVNNNLQIIDSTFKNIYSSCFASRSATLEITGSTFDNSNISYNEVALSRNSNPIDENDGVTWVIVESARTSFSLSGYTITIQGNKFIKNSIRPNYGGALRVSGDLADQIQVFANEFTENTALYGGAIYESNILSGLNLTNNNFTDNLALYGGAIYKTSTEFKHKTVIPSITTINDKYVRNIALYNGGALYLDWESLILDQSEFTECQAENGGAIHFRNLDTYNNQNGYLKSAKFFNNIASKTGGALRLFFLYSDLNETEPCIFEHNVDNSNQGIVASRPSYFVLSFYDIICEKEFSFNALQEASKDINCTSLALSVNTSQIISNQTRIKHKSGHGLTQILKVEVFDALNQLAYYINEEQIGAKIADSQNTISNLSAYITETHIFNFTKGQAFIKDSLVITGEPKTTATLNFKTVDLTSIILKEAGLSMDLNLTLDFVECEIGDIFVTSTRSCQSCLSGTYSLQSPYEGGTCKKCDSNAVCLGTSKIAPLPGFWRHGPQTDTILECLEKSACPGGYIDDKYFAQGLCSFPYEGNLCGTCVQNHAKFGSSEACSNCFDDGLYYAKFIGFIAIDMIIIVYLVKCNTERISKKDTNIKPIYTEQEEEIKQTSQLSGADLRSSVIKIIINFIQISSVLINFRFSWPTFFTEFIKVTNKVFPTLKDAFPIGCFVALCIFLFGLSFNLIANENNEYIYFAKLIATLFQPFIFWIFLACGFVLIHIIKRRGSKKISALKDQLIVLFLVVVFAVQPHIIQITLELFKCQKYTNDHDSPSFMTHDSQTQCWTGFHKKWAFGVALPFLLIWLVILPLILFYKLRKAAKHYSKAKSCSQYLFLVSGFKKNRYYWEFISLLQRTLIIVIFTFVYNTFIQDQAIIVFVVISIFLLLEFKVSPYDDERLKKLGLLSFVTLAAILYCGTAFSSDKSIYGISLLFAIVALILNSGFYFLALFYFIRSYRSQPQTPQTIRNQLIPIRLMNQMYDNLASPKTIQPLNSNEQEGIIISEFREMKNDELYSERVLSDSSFESERNIPSEPRLSVQRMSSYDVQKEMVFINRFNTVLTEAKQTTLE